MNGGRVITAIEERKNSGYDDFKINRFTSRLTDGTFQ